MKFTPIFWNSRKSDDPRIDALLNMDNYDDSSEDDFVYIGRQNSVPANYSNGSEDEGDLSSSEVDGEGNSSGSESEDEGE